VTIPARSLILALVCSALSSGCFRDSIEPVAQDKTSDARVVGILEITFSDIASAHLQATARFQRALTVPANTDGTGDATIQLDPVSAGAFTHTIGDSTFRYFHATYRVRNAQRTDHAAFDTPRRNLTFVAVGTAQTMAQTPVVGFRHADGSPADPMLARQLIPTGFAQLEADGSLGTVSPDVLQVFTEPEVAAIAAPAAVTEIFPYGFVVRRINNAANRFLAESPDSTQFDGIINFAYRIPLQPNAADDPTTIVVMMLALDDSETQLTQSIEEQTLFGRRASLLRAASLHASTATLLPGGTFPAFSGFRTICSVRTAGSAAAALAFMTNVTASFASLSPDPYASDGSGSFIAGNATVDALFTQQVNRATPLTMRIAGLQSGLAFTTDVYSGNGTTTISTPATAFFAGEEVEFTITTALSCPDAHVGRLRTATAPSTGTFGLNATFTVGADPVSAAAGDFNNDNALDLVVANAGSNTLTMLLGDGTGGFGSQRTFGSGPQTGPVAVADLNDDGNLDVAVANAGAVSVLLGNGDGTLRPRISLSGLGNVGSLVLGDLNSDAITDMVLADDRGDVQVMLGEGSGDFLSRPGGSPAFRVPGLAVGDLNGDGRLDVVSTRGAQDVVVVRLGTGAGNLQPPVETDVGNEPTGVAIADMNADGRPDLIVANRRSNDLLVLPGNGNGTFAAPFVATSSTTPLFVAIGDLNGDGRLDVAVGGESGVGTLFGNGDGTLQPESPQPQFFSSIADVGALALGDLNNDGVLDILILNQLTPGTLTVRLGIK
jgi:hypothetical protein